MNLVTKGISAIISRGECRENTPATSATWPAGISPDLHISNNAFGTGYPGPETKSSILISRNRLTYSMECGERSIPAETGEIASQPARRITIIPLYPTPFAARRCPCIVKLSAIARDHGSRGGSAKDSQIIYVMIGEEILFPHRESET